MPDESQTDLAIDVSRTLSNQPTLFTLDNQNFYPHLSLYMFQMDTEQQDACINALEDLATRQTVQHLKVLDYHHNTSQYQQGYFHISFMQSDQLNELQMACIETFNPLRAGMRESDIHKLPDASGLKRDYLLKYAYSSIGEFFNPHITLTRFLPDIQPDTSLLPNPKAFDGVFTKLGLFELGENGTCTRKIAEFNLQV